VLSSENRFVCGDAVEVLSGLPNAWAQAVIADPPYFRVLDEQWDSQWKSTSEHLAWCEQWLRQCMRVLRDDGLCFIFGQLGKREHGFIHALSRFCNLFAFHDLIIWDRVVGYNERRDSLTPAYEMILVLRKSDSVKFFKESVRVPYDEETIERYMKDKRYSDKNARLAHLRKGKFATNILSVPSLKGLSQEKCGHPSQKPTRLISQLIMMSTEQGDWVLDMFSGSGTTAFVAEELGRRWIGIEKSEEYIAMAKDRMKRARETDLPGFEKEDAP